jgi:ATP-dependent DNA helicase RecG
VLVMTATPIPRTLALTLYGDLDASVLDELPPGRTPIVTRRVPSERQEDVWEFVRKQVAQQRQAYIVYPMIEGAKDDQPELDFAAADAEAAPSRSRASFPAKKARKSASKKGRRSSLLRRLLPPKVGAALGDGDVRPVAAWGVAGPARGFAAWAAGCG